MYQLWNDTDGRTKRKMEINPLTPPRNAAWRIFLLGILLPEPCISLIDAWKTNKCNDYSFSLLIMYGSSYMFRYYIVILRKRS
jgi:hypothetical protein